MRSFYNNQLSLLFTMKIESQLAILELEEHPDKLEETFSLYDKLRDCHEEIGVGTDHMCRYLDKVIAGEIWLEDEQRYLSLGRYDRLVLAHEMSEKIYLDVRVLIANEVSKCYLGLYSPRYCRRTYDDWCIDKLQEIMIEQQLSEDDE